MMGWAGGLFGEGGAVLVVGCLVGMGLLMWLLFRLTGDSAARVVVQPPRQVAGPLFAEGPNDAEARARPRGSTSKRRACPTVRVASPRDQPAADRDRAGPGGR